MYLPLCKVADTPFHIQGDDVCTDKAICLDVIFSSFGGFFVTHRDALSGSQFIFNVIIIKAAAMGLWGSKSYISLFKDKLKLAFCSFIKLKHIEAKLGRTIFIP